MFNLIVIRCLWKNKIFCSQLEFSTIPYRIVFITIEVQGESSSTDEVSLISDVMFSVCFCFVLFCPGFVLLIFGNLW